MKAVKKKSPFFRFLTHWLTWIMGALLGLTIYLSVWPLFFHWVVLPQAVPEKHGMQVKTFDRPEVRGKPSHSYFSQSDKLILQKTETSLQAYGLWKVPQTGSYCIHMECDDFGSLILDGRELIRLTGVNARNIGETELNLKDGYHLLDLRLVNGPGQGWLSLNLSNTPANDSLLAGSALVGLDISNLNPWLRIVAGIKNGSLGLFVCSLSILAFLGLKPSWKKLIESPDRERKASGLAYLKSSVKSFGLPLTLILVYLYQILTKPDPYPYTLWVVLLLAVTIGLFIFRRSLWLVYVLLFIALTIHFFVFVTLISKGAQDPGSTRDEAVEMAAQSLLEGRNAWDKDVGVPITAGPTSILLAIPFVFLFRNINWLAFIFWMTFILVLIWFDFKQQNFSWPIMCLFLLLGYFGIEHSLYWSLEEVYFPYLFLVLAFGLVFRGNFFLIGILASAVLLSRSSYFFMIMGFSLWILFNCPWKGNQLLKMGAGFIIGSAIILLPFVIVGGENFWKNNPFNLAFSISGSTWPDSNLFFHFLNHLNGQIGPAAMRWGKLGLVLLFMIPLSLGLRRLRVLHPFWHITFGAFLAHTIVWLPAHLPMDYTLMFVLPAMLAIANTPFNTEEGVS